MNCKADSLVAGQGSWSPHSIGYEQLLMIFPGSRILASQGAGNRAAWRACPRVTKLSKEVQVMPQGKQWVNDE